MKRITLVIERREAVTLEVDVKDDCTRANIVERIASDPGKYLETHLDNVTHDQTDFEIVSLHFKNTE